MMKYIRQCIVVLFCACPAAVLGSTNNEGILAERFRRVVKRNAMKRCGFFLFFFFLVVPLFVTSSSGRRAPSFFPSGAVSAASGLVEKSSLKED